MIRSGLDWVISWSVRLKAQPSIRYGVIIGLSGRCGGIPGVGNKFRPGNGVSLAEILARFWLEIDAGIQRNSGALRRQGQAASTRPSPTTFAPSGASDVPG